MQNLLNSVWADFSHWWMNTMVRLDPAMKAWVLPLLIAVAFYCFYRLFKKADKDMTSFRKFPWFWLFLGLILFAYALWIIIAS